MTLQVRRRTAVRRLLLGIVSLFLFVGLPSASSWMCDAAPATLYWDGAHLASLREAPHHDSQEVRGAIDFLRHEADAALKRGPYSVMNKEVVPPSGDKHDYLSYSRYWWPNPDTPDGLPYVRRDGVVNRELLMQGDRYAIGHLCDDFESLTLAAYLIDQDRYAAHGVKMLRTWFLDPATKMNPNVNFGQGVPGRSTGRGVGIIDTRHFTRVLDGVALLRDIDAITEEDTEALRIWFESYLEWLLTSELGAEERRAKNNHGAWFAAQASYVALFVGQHDVAKQIVNEVMQNRITESIEPDGSQPTELGRTRSLHYSLFNLSALSMVGRVGEHLGIDLWQTESSRAGELPAIQKALDYVAPYLSDPDSWPYPEFDDFRLSHRQKQQFMLAGTRYQDESYVARANLAPPRKEDRPYSPLLFPTFSKQTHETTEGEHGCSLKVIEGGKLPSANFQLPSLSQYTVEHVASLAPSNYDGKVNLRLASDIRLLDEAFRNKRGEDLRRRQGTEDAQAIIIDEGAVSLSMLCKEIDDRYAVNLDGEVTLSLPLMIGPGATLVIDGSQTPVVRLSTDSGAFIANAGQLHCTGAKVTSWSASDEGPTRFENKSDFRPFIASYVRSETYATGSQFEHLGFAAPTAYGFSLSSHPERELGPVRDDWPMGMIVDCEFRGLYYGFYSFEARDVAIVGNLYDGCIVYGIDPHDRSVRLIIARNETTGTVEKHGIIGSRDVSHSVIFDNESHHNHGAGIMLDRNCEHNLVVNNRVYNNGQGIAVYESSENLLHGNLVAFNKQSGVRVRNSASIEVSENTIAGNGGFALEAYSKRLDDHEKRAKRGDLYQEILSVDFGNNRIAGNGGVAKANNLGLLRLGHTERDVDLGAISAELGVGLSDSIDIDKIRFGGHLVQFKKSLSRLLDGKNHVVEVRGLAPGGAKNQ